MKIDHLVLVGAVQDEGVVLESASWHSKTSAGKEL
jgi:hypothetical protein